MISDFAFTCYYADIIKFSLGTHEIFALLTASTTKSEDDDDIIHHEINVVDCRDQRLSKEISRCQQSHQQYK